jgi:HEAT repeat protein
MPTSAARVLTLLAHPTNPQQVAQEIDQLAASDVTAHPSVVPALMRAATGNGNELVRAACVRAIVRGKVKDAGTIASLERMMNDESVKVQVEAATGLMELHGATK